MALILLRKSETSSEKTKRSPCFENVKPRAAIYGRVSSSRQRNSGELARQLGVLRKHCEANGYVVRKSYSEVGSGLNDARCGLLRLLNDASKGYYDVVVVTYNDRLARFGLRVIREY